MKLYFSHERLNVYQASIRLVTIVSPIIEKTIKRLAVIDQLDRASTSIPLNIAEGNGRYTPPDRCRFFDTARGSALECAACVDVLVAKGRLSEDEAETAKALLCEIVNMLVGLIRAVDSSRVAEDATDGSATFQD
jgi:four helix bundle protein